MVRPPGNQLAKSRIKPAINQLTKPKLKKLRGQAKNSRTGFTVTLKRAKTKADIKAPPKPVTWTPGITWARPIKSRVFNKIRRIRNHSSHP
jgi:hypothetical protein